MGIPSEARARPTEKYNESGGDQNVNSTVARKDQDRDCLLHNKTLIN